MAQTAPGPPYYVVLGGTNPGIYPDRPENTALGNFKPLIPIVVTCSRLQDAQDVNALNDKIFKRADPHDAHTLAYLIQESRLDAQIEKIYGIRSGKETGIWIGFRWRDIEHNIMDGGQKNAWERRDSIGDALVYMLSKPGYNIPLTAPGQRIKAPPAKADMRFPTPGVRAPPLSPTKTPTARRIHPIQSPSGRRGASPTAFNVHSPPSLSYPSASGVQIRAAASQQGTYNDNGEDALSDAFHDCVVIGNEFNEVLPSLPIQLLRRIVTPLPSMIHSGSQSAFPITFGTAADNILSAKGATLHTVLTVLQARVHSLTPETFAYHLNKALRWNAEECDALWSAIELSFD